MTTRVCEAPLCTEVIPMGKPMCESHWLRVPRAIQRRVSKFSQRMRLGDASAIGPYKAAVQDAVATVKPSRRSRHAKEPEMNDA